MPSQIIDYYPNNPNENSPQIYSNNSTFQRRGSQKFLPKNRNPKSNWFQKLISKPNILIPVTTLTIFAIFFGYNFALRTGGVSPSNVVSSSSSSDRSITARRILSEPVSQNLEFESNTLNHILITGQSLSVGETGFPALSDFQPYENYRIKEGRIEPLIENVILTGYKKENESIASSFANSLTFHSKNQKYQTIISNNGLGGTRYEGLKKGTKLYQRNLSEIELAAEFAKTKNLKYQVRAVFVIHGESDNQAGNGSKYQSFLEEWYRDYNTDIKNLTGQKDDIYLFTDQMSSFGNPLATKEKADPATTLAQLKAAQNPKIVLVAPKYFLNYNDNLHLNNLSYRKLGEYYAKAYQETILQNQKWEPLKPISTILDRNIVKIKFAVKKLPLVLDTTVLERENYGFKIVENTNSKITKVQINGDTVEIILDKIPSQNAKIQYALDANFEKNGAGSNKLEAAAGNLRDSDNSTSIYGNNLPNWAVHFEETLQNEQN